MAEPAFYLSYCGRVLWFAEEPCERCHARPATHYVIEQQPPTSYNGSPTLPVKFTRYCTSCSPAVMPAISEAPREPRGLSFWQRLKREWLAA